MTSVFWKLNQWCCGFQVNAHHGISRTFSPPVRRQGLKACRAGNILRGLHVATCAQRLHGQFQYLFPHLLPPAGVILPHFVTPGDLDSTMATRLKRPPYDPFPQDKVELRESSCAL